MADRVKKIKYCYIKVPNRAGQGERILGQLRDSGVDLLVYSGFPIGGGKAQLDFVPRNMIAFRKVARKNGWHLSKAKKGFLVTGGDQLRQDQHHCGRRGCGRQGTVRDDPLGEPESVQPGSQSARGKVAHWR
jgi:hypothetical protein